MVWQHGKTSSLRQSYLLAINLVTIVLYGYDKMSAKMGSGSRVPETVLHGVAFCGGSLGALVGQEAFHHKRSKKSFRLVYWRIVTLHAIVLALWWIF